MSAALMVMLVVAGFVAPLGTALASAVVHADRTPITWCVSCLARPATHTETVDGVRFLVCQSCRNGGRS